MMLCRFDAMACAVGGAAAPLSPSDLCVVYGTDGVVWFNHFVSVLRQPLPRLGVLAVDEGRLRGAASSPGHHEQLCADVSRAHSLLVIATPGQCVYYMLFLLYLLLKYQLLVLFLAALISRKL